MSITTLSKAYLVCVVAWLTLTTTLPISTDVVTEQTKIVPIRRQVSLSKLIPNRATDSLRQAILRASESLMKQHKVPGLAIAIIRDGKIAWTECIGLADVSGRKPVTQQTVFNVGSISKNVAAWGFMQLIERGVIGLDEPVTKYLTSWKLPKSDFDKSGVTMRRLLSHTAGLSVHGYPGYLPGETLPDLAGSLSGAQAEKDVRLVYAPGAKWQYSGGGYTVMELLLEERTAQPFRQYMLNNVFAPLGLKSTDFGWRKQLLAQAATPYDENGKSIERRNFTELAAAGLQTTITDLAHFAEYSLTSDPKQLAGVLKPQTIQLMQQPVPPASSEGESSLGYQIMRYGGLTTIGHTGSNAGWTASLFLDPVSKSGIVMMTNSTNGLPVMIPIYSIWANEVKRMSVQSSTQIRLDITGLVQTKAATVVNRSVTLLADQAKKGIRVDERPGVGLVWLPDIHFTTGTVEFDVRGKDALQKSFVGLAFHGSNDSTYEAIYFRPFNFRSDDLVRRSHSVQYIAHPTYTWQKLRVEQPGRYESAIAIAPIPNPNGWFHIRVNITNTGARVFVNENSLPVLVVNRLEHSSGEKIGFWVGNDSGGDFADLTIMPIK